MILTVTINPLLENRIELEKLKYGEVSRGTKRELKAGGKGINVSRQLDYLSIKNTALLFLGGNNGKLLRKVMIDENINFTSVSSKAETRGAAIAIEKSKKKITSIFEPTNRLTDNEINEFKTKLIKMIQNCSIVVFSGSVQNKEAASIISYGIELANELDKVSILDTYGEHLQNCIDAAPTVLHNNKSEIENSLNRKLNNQKDKVEFLKEIYNKGVKIAFVTDGNKPTIASKFGFLYKIQFDKVDEIDATGSGDAFVAGVAYGLERALVFDEFVRVASALGAVNAQKWEVCTGTFNDIESFTEKVKVKPIGKKMKLINDSPTHK